MNFLMRWKIKYLSGDLTNSFCVSTYNITFVLLYKIQNNKTFISILYKLHNIRYNIITYNITTYYINF